MFSRAVPHYCTDCAVLKPNRTHHCRRCGVCVPKLDHHCPVLGEFNDMT